MILTLYLYITLGAVILMKTAVLHTQGIEFEFWGVGIVKAVVLAKFIMIGQAMKVGDRSIGALIWPTLHKAFAFLLLLVILTTIEEVVVGLSTTGRLLLRSANLLAPGSSKYSPAT